MNTSGRISWGGKRWQTVHPLPTVRRKYTGLGGGEISTLCHTQQCRIYISIQREVVLPSDETAVVGAYIFAPEA